MHSAPSESTVQPLITAAGPGSRAPASLQNATMTDARTPKVQLVLRVEGEKPKEPQVLKATKRHLKCEYDGLVFKQARDEPPAAPAGENTPANRGVSPRASVLGRAGASQATPAAPQASNSLEALCAGLFEAEAREAQAGGNPEVAAALLDICRRLCAGGASLGLGGAAAELQRGEGAGLAAANEEVEQGDYQVDLEARKAGLRARLAGYNKEAADWEQLMWEAEQYTCEPAGVEAAAEADSPESDAMEPADVAELKKMHVDLHRHLTMQAEGLCKLVGDVEELVDRANRTAHSLQTEYHQEKFRAFPHVDSPARLIKEIVKPPAKRVQQ